MFTRQVPRATPICTEFLSASNAVQLVAQTGIIECLRVMTQAIEYDFGRWQEFEKTARTAAHSGSGVIELMPVSNARDFAFKYVNGHPQNPQYGLPTVMAFGALTDVATGAPRFVSELTLTTALRTAATSLMVAKKLARENSFSMALIGNGSQSEFQALAFIGLLGIRKLRLFDVDEAASRKLLRNIEPWLQKSGATARICKSATEAMRGVDIITTITADKSRSAVLRADMLEPGMHINAVGGDCPGKTEIDSEVLEQASVFVEYEPQTRIEGDLQQMREDYPVTEFWRVLQQHAPGRTSNEQITLFDSVGFALEDYSALRTMQALGAQTGLLEEIELIPTLNDPKDLFALIKNAKPASSASTVLRRAALDAQGTTAS